MMKYIKDSLALSALVKSKMATDDLNQLETLKEQLKDRFGVPVGVHMTGIPLAVSTLLAIFLLRHAASVPLVVAVSLARLTRI
ncbi:hypothetical protein [Enterobacter hormaechei]|uniref:hypothetical protein n=1 Tax=Enterobacter hormaechei TaxID=158836 RepID=UPI000AF94214|nr:hypothetical protein [Enterobacter hormaechei]